VKKIAVVALLAIGALTACGGDLFAGRSGYGLPVESGDAAAVSPRHAHVIVPFVTGRKPISSSDGQEVYALFGGSSLPFLKALTNLTAYGTPAVNGYAGPLAQLALVTSSTEQQHAYLAANGTLAELTDKATKVSFYVSYPKADESLADVCRGKEPIGTIEGVTTHGKTTWTVKKTGAKCPNAMDAIAVRAPAVSSAAASSPSKANVDFYVCSLSSGPMALVADEFTEGAQLDAPLGALGSAYSAFDAFLAGLCTTGVTLAKAQKPPSCGDARTHAAVCSFEEPPIPIVPVAANCAQASATLTFNAPGQSCQVSVPYSLGSATGQFTVTSSNASIVSVTPASGTITGSGSVSFTLTAGGAGGSATVTETVTIDGRVFSETYFNVTNAWVTSATPPPEITDYTIPTSGSMPEGITVGPDSALWFTEALGNKIGRITTDGKIREMPIPKRNVLPVAIVAGPDGALWFTEHLNGAIGRITTDGSVSEYTIPTSNGHAPFGITAGPDGALWFADTDNYIGRVTTGGTFSLYPTSHSDSYIVAGPDGALWFTCDTHEIGRITTTGKASQFGLPAGSLPEAITVGPDGALWFEDNGRYNIGRITTSGHYTYFPTPDGAVGASGITQGPDSALWFSGNASFDPIGSITTSGVFAYPTLAYSQTGQVWGIVLGPDGALWYTDYIHNRIVRFAPSTVTSSSRKRSR